MLPNLLPMLADALKPSGGALKFSPNAPKPPQKLREMTRRSELTVYSYIIYSYG